MATQVLIWETVVGERDEDFDYVSPGSYDAVKGVISTAHPLYDLFCDYYDSIEASVQRHSAIPSFMSKNPNRAQSVELEWDGSSYAKEGTCSSEGLTDGRLISDKTGLVEFTGLHPERLYRLTETAAPDGFQLLADIAYEGGLPDDREYTVDLTVVNVRTYELPETGSKSLGLMPIALILACSLCGAILFVTKRKKQ